MSEHVWKVVGGLAAMAAVQIGLRAQAQPQVQAQSTAANTSSSNTDGEDSKETYAFYNPRVPTERAEVARNVPGTFRLTNTASTLRKAKVQMPDKYAAPTIRRRHVSDLLTSRSRPVLNRTTQLFDNTVGFQGELRSNAYLNERQHIGGNDHGIATSSARQTLVPQTQEEVALDRPTLMQLAERNFTGVSSKNPLQRNPREPTAEYANAPSNQTPAQTIPSLRHNLKARAYLVPSQDAHAPLHNPLPTGKLPSGRTNAGTRLTTTRTVESDEYSATLGAPKFGCVQGKRFRKKPLMYARPEQMAPDVPIDSSTGTYLNKERQRTKQYDSVRAPSHKRVTGDLSNFQGMPLREGRIENSVNMAAEHRAAVGDSDYEPDRQTHFCESRIESSGIRMERDQDARPTLDSASLEHESVVAALAESRIASTDPAHTQWRHADVSALANVVSVM